MKEKTLTSLVGGTPCLATPERIEQALSQAGAAVHVTRKLSLHDRAAILERIAAALVQAGPTLAQQLADDSGFLTATDMQLEVQRTVEVFRLAAAATLCGFTQALDLDAVDRARGSFGLIRREPIGAVLAITAFNGPLLIPAHKLAPAIAAGAPIVLKPAPRVARSALDLARIALEAGWPAQALAVLDVDNDATMALIKDERLPVVSFTGGEFGWKLKEVVPRKHVHLELGGVGAVLVAEDANLEQAARECAAGAFVRSGQSCISVQRIYVARPVYARFTDLLAAAVRQLAQATPIGPLVDEHACTRVEDMIRQALDAGGKLVCGGRREGNAVQPTVIAEATPTMRLMREEVFGPVVAITPFDAAQEAIADINAVGGAIHHGVYTADLDFAFAFVDEVRAGGVIINGPCTWRVDHMPYGGVGNSGFGREGILSAIHEYTEPKVVVVRPSGSRGKAG